MKYNPLSETPLVSIFTVVKNRAYTIKRCVDSILAQDYPNIEIIVQDGASTDGTLEILQEYGNRIKFVSEPDSGPGEAFFRALDKVKGEFFGSCMSDEELMPHAVSWAVENLLKYPDVAAIYGDYYSIDINGKILSANKACPWDFKRYLCCEIVPPFCSSFFRKSCFDAIGLREYTDCGEFDLWLRLGIRFPIRYEPGLVSKFGVHPGSCTRQVSVYYLTLPGRIKAINRLLDDSRTPKSIHALRERALAGLHLWIAQTFIGLNAIDEAREQIQTSLKYQPKLDRLIAVAGGVTTASHQLTMQPPNLDIKSEDKIFVFGAGEGGRQCLDWIKEREATVIGLIDNDKDKEGLTVEGIPIFGPKRLEKRDFDKIIIASTYWFEIKNQLEKMGFIEGEDFGLLSKPTMNLAGDRDIEWSWVASQMPQGPGKALDFGNGGSYLGLIAAQRGFEVTAVDLTSVQWPYTHPQLSFIKGDILKLPFSKEHFDLVINCSTVEHVGLVGRYDVKENRPDGDLKAMAHLRKLMRPDGVMLLTIPVGQDAVFTPLARVYGTQRLTQLLEGYTVEKEEFWVKDRENRWVLGDKDTALNFKASMGSWDPLQNVCALGCFVLRCL